MENKASIWEEERKGKKKRKKGEKEKKKNKDSENWLFSFDENVKYMSKYLLLSWLQPSPGFLDGLCSSAAARLLTEVGSGKALHAAFKRQGKSLQSVCLVDVWNGTAKAKWGGELIKRKVRTQMFLREAKTKNKFVAPIS